MKPALKILEGVLQRDFGYFQKLVLWGNMHCPHSIVFRLVEALKETFALSNN